MKVFVSMTLSHERPSSEDVDGTVHHTIDVVDFLGVGEDEAEAFQHAWQQAGLTLLAAGVSYTLHWERVEPPAQPSEY